MNPAQINEGTMGRVIVAQAIEIQQLQDRLAGAQQARNAAEKGLARLKADSKRWLEEKDDEIRLQRERISDLKVQVQELAPKVVGL